MAYERGMREWSSEVCSSDLTTSILVGAPGAELIWTNCAPMPQRTSVAVTPSTAPTSSDKASGLVMVYPLRDRCADRASEYCFFASYTSAPELPILKLVTSVEIGRAHV